MTRRRLAVVVSLVAGPLLVAGVHSRQLQQPTPTFRSDVDLIAIDVSVLDGEGRPVGGLTAQDFTVTVDGQARPVATVEYISRGSGPGAPSVPDDPAITDNHSRPPGQQVLLVVDAAGTSGGARSAVLAAAEHLVQGVAEGDRLALATVPASAAAVEFTTNHALVRERLTSIGGWMSPALLNQPFTVSEALACDRVRGDPNDCSRTLQRVCDSVRDPAERQRCVLELQSTMAAVIVELRARAAVSLNSLTTLVGALAAVEGPKTLVLFSEAMLLSDVASEVDRIARVAAQSRVRIHVFRAVRQTGGSSEGVMRPAGLSDQHLLGEALELVAGRTGGQVLSLAANPRAASETLITELSGYYLLGVESQPADRDGKAHALRVRVNRTGLSVRARAEFVAPATPPPRTAEEVVAAALRDPVGRSALPVTVRTYRLPEDASAVRVIIAADFAPAGPGTRSVGFALLGEKGSVVVSGFDEGVPGNDYLRSVVVKPGEYDLKLAAVDDGGRVGSVMHHAPGGLRRVGIFLAGDLIVGSATASGDLRPPVSRGISGGAIGVALPLFAEDPSAVGDTQVTIEIARDGDPTPAIAVPAPYATRSAVPGLLMAQARVPVADLSPGAYVVSAVVRENGRETGRIIDRFTLLPSTAPENTGAAPAPPRAGDTAGSSGPRVWLAVDPLHAAPQSADTVKAIEAMRIALERGRFRTAASPHRADVRVELAGQRQQGAGSSAAPGRSRGSREVVLIRTTVSRGDEVAELRGRSSTSDFAWVSAAEEAVHAIEQWLRNRESTPADSKIAVGREDAAPSQVSDIAAELLPRLRTYVGGYQESASAIVAEEHYRQQYWRRRFPYPAPLHLTRRELRSEMGFSFFAGAGIWFGFRDVLEVDGSPVRNREKTLHALFLDPPSSSEGQFRRAAEAGARFNIGPTRRDFNVPLMPLLFASPQEAGRCRFELLRIERLDGVETAVIAFTETARPTLITRSGHARPSRGLLWVEPLSGRVRKTELSVREDEVDVRLTTWYGHDDHVGVMVPIRMREVYDYVERLDEFVETRATYTNFRRFEATTRIVP